MGSMKNYRQLVQELPSKTVVFVFGRFNPPTTGHELLFKVVKKIATQNKADHVIYASRTQDEKKNPLAVDRKIHYLKMMFKGFNFVQANENENSFIEAATHLNKKYQNIIMVAGSDRVAEYESLLNKYNGKNFKFQTIQVVSAGEGDPDSDSASGMSASKMRTAASKGNYIEFKKGLPTSVRDIDGKLLMNELRQGMGLDPIKEEVKFTIDVLREKYFKGEIYHIGEIVESNGQQYEIMDRGSNYLVVVDKTGELHRKWIKDVTLCEPITEDIKPGYAPKEISYKGYTTQNLHHSADATKAFQDTIEKANSNKIENDPVAILNALKATDTYMKLNDMHLQKGKSPTEKETQQWIDSHDAAKKSLDKLGEFPHHLDYWNTHKTELQLMSNDFKETGKGEFSEELTNKTIRPSDKIKVARIIGDMLGVDNPERISSPTQLINMGMRKLKNKVMRPELLNVLSKMLKLADELDIKYDKNALPAKLKESVVVKKGQDYNIAGDILRYSDYVKLKKLNKGIVDKDVETDEKPQTTAGHSLGSDHHTRRRKVKYKTESVEEIEEDVYASDFKVNPETGRKFKAHRVNFANSKMNAKPDDTPNPDEDKNEYKKDVAEADTVKIGKVIPLEDKDKHTDEYAQDKGFDPFFEEDEDGNPCRIPCEDVPEEEIDKMIADIDDEEDIYDLYDDDELVIVDDETGEEIKEDIQESQELMEVLSKTERIRARIRFARTKAKRGRKLRIALKRHSSMPIINRRAGRLAIKLMKKRLAKKPLNKLSIGEKERIERLMAKRRPLIKRIAMKLVPRVRKVETARLAHKKVTKGSSIGGF